VAAAIKIQSAYRNHRKRFWEQMEEAVIKIQSRVRMKMAIRQKEKKKKELHEAATKIQTAFKKYRGKR